MQMMMKDYFYQFSKLVAGDDQNIKKSFDDIIDNWKNLPCTKISKVLRDKVQHGSILSPNLKIDVQTSNHPSGESASLFISDEEIFDKVKTELYFGRPRILKFYILSKTMIQNPKSRGFKSDDNGIFC
jgi:hypothetical protein